MDKITFICLLDQWQKNQCVYLHSDIVAMIYTEYIATFYHKYTLFQLISMMDMKNYHISCQLNKKAIVKLIDQRNYKLPDKNRYDKQEKTEWSIFHIKYIDYRSYPHSTFVSMNILSIDNTHCRSEVMQEDVIKVKTFTYKIHKITDDQNIILLDMNDNTETKMPINLFIKIMDEEDVTIIKNLLREKRTLSSYMDMNIMRRVA
jgi:hypothetical protein